MTYEVDCYDAVGRRRHLRLSRGERGVAIIAPPGEVAEVSWSDVDALRDHLTQLAVARLLPAARTGEPS